MLALQLVLPAKTDSGHCHCCLIYAAASTLHPTHPKIINVISIRAKQMDS